MRKGFHGGPCNRTACQAPDARWFNPAMVLTYHESAHMHLDNAYYCEACAKLINKFAVGWQVLSPEDPKHPWFVAEPKPGRQEQT